MSPAEGGPFEPASFRDPAARVLRHDGQILRYLTPAAWRDFELLSSTRFYREFTDAGRLVATTEASRSQIPPALRSLGGGAAASDHPRRVLSV